jgi:uncharacterized repeat protein (TIGR03803 family)
LASDGSTRALLNFGTAAGGREPNGGLLLDLSGNLYGATREGGFHNRGVVFEIAP